MVYIIVVYIYFFCCVNFLSYSCLQSFCCSNSLCQLFIIQQLLAIIFCCLNCLQYSFSGILFCVDDLEYILFVKTTVIVQLLTQFFFVVMSTVTYSFLPSQQFIIQLWLVYNVILLWPLFLNASVVVSTIYNAAVYIPVYIFFCIRSIFCMLTLLFTKELPHLSIMLFLFSHLCTAINCLKSFSHFRYLMAESSYRFCLFVCLQSHTKTNRFVNFLGMSQNVMFTHTFKNCSSISPPLREHSFMTFHPADFLRDN